MIRLGSLGGLALASVGALAMSACTHLEVNRFEGAGTQASRAGFVYMLDFTQYEVTVTRTLVACPAGKLPTIKVEATATSTLVPDGAQVYVIDPQPLVGAFKISDVTVDFKDGRLVGFNSTVEDKTGEVIKSVGSTVGKIALLATGIPAPINGSVAPPIGCSADAAQHLAGREANRKLLTAGTKVLDDAKEKLSDLTTRYTAKPTETLAKQLKAQKGIVEAAQKNVDGLQKKIQEATGALTRVTSTTWPDTSTAFDSDAMLPLDGATIKAWFDEKTLLGLIRDKIGTPKIETDDAGVVTLVNGGASGNAARLKLTEAQFARTYLKTLFALG